MNTKLTLTLEKSVIETAKKYASENGQSLSGIVENYFKFLAGNKTKKRKKELEISPFVRSLRGSVSVPSDFDYKKELEKIRVEKYLK